MINDSNQPSAQEQAFFRSFCRSSQTSQNGTAKPLGAGPPAIPARALRAKRQVAGRGRIGLDYRQPGQLLAAGQVADARLAILDPLRLTG
jgi:hypothetical protein